MPKLDCLLDHLIQRLIRALGDLNHLAALQKPTGFSTMDGEQNRAPIPSLLKLIIFQQRMRCHCRPQADGQGRKDLHQVPCGSQVRQSWSRQLCYPLACHRRQRD